MDMSWNRRRGLSDDDQFFLKVALKIAVCDEEAVNQGRGLGGWVVALRKHMFWQVFETEHY